MSATVTAQPEKPAPTIWCDTCMERGRQVPMFRMVRGTAMCKPCFSGEDSDSVAERKKPWANRQQPSRRNRKLADAKAIVAPFLELADAAPCVNCGEKREVGSLELCIKCRTRRRAVTDTKSRLRAYKANGDAKFLQMAAAAIVRLKLTPDEFRKW